MNVFITDMYEPHILRYSNKEVGMYHKFNFGKYSMPPKYYKFDTPYEAMEYSHNRECALVDKFKKSSVFEIVEIGISTDDTTISNSVYGLNIFDKWLWFDAGRYYKDPIAGLLKDVRGNSLYFLVFPHLVGKLEDFFGDLAFNPESIDNYSEENNYVVVKITLRDHIEL